ncbi:hypothetical protein HPP92_010484 [Vanilla planifolia]|uniref:procollagen-proline 4-dioxygenase n=1 Tax=Vanilla planifolia TaxID=51239 RepID=A0A835R6K0_VANPL|nr:hypothetical protein HPP92_010484 [Vanilla planifolia]
MTWSVFRVSFLLVLPLLCHLSCCSSYTSSQLVNPSRARQISWKPRAFVYEGFLTDEECDHLISLAKSELKRSAVADNLSGKSTLSEVRTSSGTFISKGKECDHLISLAKSELKRSAVADNLSGKSTLSEVRTSSGTFISKGKDNIISGIEDRIAAWTFLPKENGEDIQVLKYEHGQKYDAHYDFFSDHVNIARGGHRIATVLMYLSDVGKGGETVFPSAEESLRHSNAKDDLSECARHGIAVKPKKGDALLFFSLYPNAAPDRSSLHGGCPVIEGEKWSATKWIHVASFDKMVTSHGNCTDNNPSCDRWAALGECTKNPEYMVGTSELPGYCRRSCNVC